MPLGKLFLNSPNQILLLVIYIWRNAIVFITVPRTVLQAMVEDQTLLFTYGVRSNCSLRILKTEIRFFFGLFYFRDRQEGLGFVILSHQMHSGLPCLVLQN